MAVDLDLDSFCLDLSVSSMSEVCAVKLGLGSSTFRPHGDKLIKDMMVVSNYPQVFVSKVFKGKLVEIMKAENIQFDPHESQLALA